MGTESYTMNDFRAEMRRRGIPDGSRAPERPIPRKRHKKHEPWKRFSERIRALCRGRIARFSHFTPSYALACPWGALFGSCDKSCRCEGKGHVTAGFMVAHYRLMLSLYGGKGQ